MKDEGLECRGNLTTSFIVQSSAFEKDNKVVKYGSKLDNVPNHYGLRPIENASCPIPFSFFLNEKLKILTQCSHTLRRDCSSDIQLFIHYHPFHPPQNNLLCYMLVRWPFPHHHIFVFTIEVCLACWQLVFRSNFTVH